MEGLVSKLSAVFVINSHVKETFKNYFFILFRSSEEGWILI